MQSDLLIQAGYARSVSELTDIQRIGIRAYQRAQNKWMADEREKREQEIKNQSHH